MFNNINMNFFNVQFLILIAIIIVIYFLYKEINFLHKKINKLQDSVENKNKNSNIPNKINDAIKETFNMVSSSESSSDHIAIYSNDNETSSTSTTKSKPNDKNIVLEIKNDQSEDELVINETNDEEPVNESVNDPDNKISASPINEPDNKLVKEIITETVIETVNEINKDSLEKMKLPELKKIAEDKQVTLSKKINGLQKSKSKKELIDDILNKL